jgi:hypothetical protein
MPLGKDMVLSAQDDVVQLPSTEGETLTKQSVPERRKMNMKSIPVPCTTNGNGLPPKTDAVAF